MAIPAIPVDEATTSGGARLFFFDGLNTDYVVTDGATVFGHAPTFKGAALIQHAHGGRIRLNGRDFCPSIQEVAA